MLRNSGLVFYNVEIKKTEVSRNPRLAQTNRTEQKTCRQDLQTRSRPWAGGAEEILRQSGGTGPGQGWSQGHAPALAPNAT